MLQIHNFEKIVSDSFLGPRKIKLAVYCAVSSNSSVYAAESGVTANSGVQLLIKNLVAQFLTQFCTIQQKRICIQFSWCDLPHRNAQENVLNIVLQDHIIIDLQYIVIKY